MEQTDLKAGSVVKLKSGGPSMTIRWVSQDKVHCDWFVGREVRSSDFTISQLRPAEPESPQVYGMTASAVTNG